MENVIIIAILAIILILAVFRTVKHFKGGGCCSSGSTTIRDKKTLTAPIIGKKVIAIEGMTCENCEIRVQNALNRLDGVLCKANWRKKTADIAYSAEISDEQLRETVEKLGYEVTSIHD